MRVDQPQDTRCSVYRSQVHTPISFYNNVKGRRGAGRARIALIRKLCGIMRSMLITGEQFRTINTELYNKKARQFDRTIKIMDQEKKSA